MVLCSTELQMMDHSAVAEADNAANLGDDYEDSSVASLRSSILQHQSENGRTYHAMSAGKYNYPNDERENDRLELQSTIWKLTLDGELAVAPAHKTARRVLDMGTGTGVWAVDYAETFPEAEVIGVDLSPTQPQWAPPNCKFEIDDLEKPWTWSEPFDYIFCRTMEGSFTDPADIVRKAYKALSPGGWFEAGGFVLPLGCDDGTLIKGSALSQWQELMVEAGEKIGRSIESPAKYTDAMKEAGFVDITVKKYVWPLNSWPKDKKLKEIGRWHHVNLDQGFEGLSLALFTRALNWTKEEVLALCAEARKELKSKSTHAYWNVQVTYARKSEETDGAKDV
ncbi:methyltransferase domain-containing protein [Colletotrichum karsti]|uniref:Methyltransferase domain-containing protein n=1 Tax=Colletotrichum karsti TaxID=1095194 RepID=A0A9P6HVE3_9PEZI|nr:methyltransferase domain-containing protein [Colletotrichum karsti]KAF9871074.1 methyltransferase domain-containing protein [Colletotrichum karsti]